jgi:dienelactone hydrolase
MRVIPLLVFAAIFAASVPTSAQDFERIPTPFTENGKAVSLEVVVFKPSGEGPFPVLMFNHRSTGRGDKPAFFTRTFTHHPIARFFTERGWLVAFPQRRGRGKSDGVYDEGFDADRSGYSCMPALSLQGMERALADLDAVVEYLKQRSDVDSKRIVIGGVSRGGILAIVHAGTRPQHYVGAINFVGGWMTDRCPNAEAINTISFARGAGFGRLTLWLYGENDSYYRMGHSRHNFDTFERAGGKGMFQTFSIGADGHALLWSPGAWRETVGAFVEQAR